MRNNYKFSAVVFIALVLISAQGVEAQRPTPKTNHNNPHYNDRNDRQERNDHWEDPRDRGRGESGYRYGKYRNDRFEGQFGSPGNGHKYGHYKRHDHRVRHQFHGGAYYQFYHGRWARMNAPVGMWVQYMPYGTEVIYTRHGVIYRFGTVYFERARRGGGFIVINGPGRRVW